MSEGWGIVFVREKICHEGITREESKMKALSTLEAAVFVSLELFDGSLMTAHVPTKDGYELFGYIDGLTAEVTVECRGAMLYVQGQEIADDASDDDFSFAFELLAEDVTADRLMKYLAFHVPSVTAS